MPTNGELMTVTEARKELEISKVLMARLIKDGTLSTEPHPFDRRAKLVRRAEVEQLKARLAALPKARAA